MAPENGSSQSAIEEDLRTFTHSYNWHRACQTTLLLRDSHSLSLQLFAVAATFYLCKYIDYNVAMTFILNDNNIGMHNIEGIFFLSFNIKIYQQTLAMTQHLTAYYAPNHTVGGNKHCFCPSVCLSIHCLHSK